MTYPDSGQVSEPAPHTKEGQNTSEIIRRILLKFIVPALILIILWQLVAYLTRTSLFDVAIALIRLATEGDSEGHFLSEHVQMSLTRVTIGFVIATATAIPLGVAVGRYRLVNSILGPVVEALLGSFAVAVPLLPVQVTYSQEPAPYKQ